MGGDSPSTASAQCSLEVAEQIVRNAVVLALAQLLELPLAVPLAVGAEADALDAGVVLGEPAAALRQALRLNLFERILVLLARLEMRSMILGEVLEEGRAVREAHR
eukprot:TRINITY_DN749_c0_g1_i2.p1 TRINITY_DN749_c0_g1~~TRINITY_DN749_c0_g1_i2.p1  ORF type:complete len:106 (-),score=5.65 TRINITY_DN749_c0_g1_i2:194-511(-)